MAPYIDHVLALPNAEWEALERVVARFEQAWWRNERPRISDYLPLDECRRTEVLIEMVHADLEFRLAAGEAPRTEEYLRSFPEITHDRDVTLGLIMAEFELRLKQERELSCDEFIERFPEYASDVAQCFETLSQEDCARTRVSPRDLLPHSQPMSRMGKFEILEEIGRGAFGVVYRAIDIELDRMVALKLPRPDLLPPPDDLERSLREARSTARLRHPNIVAVYESGQIEGVWYLASELILGLNLAERLRIRAFAFRDAAALTARIAEALGHAHERGVIHRDLKPSNILIDAEDCPHVTDFGLAKGDSSESTHSSAGQFLGTPAFMSPEQARGDSHKADGRSDLYSLGVVLYQLLTNEIPFRGHPQMVQLQVLTKDPRPPRSLDRKIPRDLETICLTAMAREPAQRYATGAEMAEDLRRFLRGEPIKTRRIRVWKRVLHRVSRRPAIAVVLGLVLLSTTLGIGGLVWGHRRAEHAWYRYNLELYINTIANASCALSENDANRARQALEKSSPRFRGWEWHYLRRRCDQNPLQLRGHLGLVSHASFSPGGRHLASVGSDATLRLWDVDSGGESHLLCGLTSPANAVAWSASGRELVTVESDGTLRLWLASTGREVWSRRLSSGGFTCAVWSPDGHSIASGGEDRTVRVHDAATGAEMVTLHGHDGRINSLAYSPDGERLASAGADETIRVWEQKTSRQVGLIPNASPASAGCLAWDPGGRRLASPGGDGAVRIWDVDQQKAVMMFEGHSGEVLGMAYHPGGDRLATAGVDGTVRIWNAEDGREMLLLRDHRDVVRSVAFSLDGRRLVSSGGVVIMVWDAGPFHGQPPGDGPSRSALRR